MGVDRPEAEQRLAVEDLARLQDAARRAVYVDPGVLQYAVDLVTATRDPARHGLADIAPYLDGGVSSRATLGLVAAARALALLRRRSFALPQDVYDVAPEVLAHRLGVTYDAGRRVEPGHLLARILASVPAPRLTPTQDTTARALPPAPGPRRPGRPRPPPAPAWCGRHERGPRPPAPSPPRRSGLRARARPAHRDCSPHGDHAGRVPGSAPRRREPPLHSPGTTPGGSTGT